ncbi:MAG: UDP-N-acetylmuramoyl-L-alanine--D-glutamate ligase [Bacteroidetes bacterium]|nr:MAG: UDP-N-acetylmuramoyl-L-alanine--D-glutamate ligase [Bacteroidota bacterium]
MNVAILGAGESGAGAAILAARLGGQVWLSDSGKIQETYREALLSRNIPFEEGAHTKEKFFEADIIVKSPGIPGTAPLVQELRAAGKEVISEIEFASRYTDVPVLAITGSNGKTTTTSLVYHLLRSAGVDAALGGNIGNSFAWLVAESPKPAYYVLEISSFQLDDIRSFRPKIALLLNITPDHLDRYAYSMDLYAAAKFRITENQQASDVFIYGQDDPETAARIGAYELKADLKPFALSRKEGSAAWMEGQDLMTPAGKVAGFGDMQLIGRHNQLNALAAVLAAQACGVGEADIEAGLKSFQPIAHRLEPVGELDGVRYINDSKATNVDSVFFALEGMTRPLVWLAGGVDKGNDYGPLQPFVKEKVKSIIVLGAYAEKFYRDFDKPVVQVSTMHDAVTEARKRAVPGDVVLLSPACASFDLFRNYEDRGDQFRSAVQQMIQLEQR